MGQSAITLESHLCGKGASFDEIFSATTTAAYFRASTNSEFAWDDIRLIAGTRSTVETFTHNNANEQLTHTKNGVTTDMEYDAWGRLTKRDDGTHEATYAYRYGSKLYSVTSDFPGEGSVTYETGGDAKRRSRVAGTDEAWYNYTVGFDVVSTENDADGSSGALTMTNVVIASTAPVSATLGDLAGTTPASGTARYYAFDHLGSTRSAWNASKVQVGNYGFDPYGGEFAHVGVAMSSLAGAYTGKPWDWAAKLFHFPYRQYRPDMARWTTRDPLGMVDGPNLYAYVKGGVLSWLDPLGASQRPMTWPRGPRRIPRKPGPPLLPIPPDRQDCDLVDKCERNCYIGYATAQVALDIITGVHLMACTAFGPIGALICMAGVTAAYGALSEVLHDEYESCLSKCRRKEDGD